MHLLNDFFSSDLWDEVKGRVFATFSLSATGTIANAISAPAEIPTQIVTTVGTVIDLIYILTVMSYVMSIAVASTVVFRFIIWTADRHKVHKLRKHKQNKTKI